MRDVAGLRREASAQLAVLLGFGGEGALFSDLLHRVLQVNWLHEGEPVF